jgi:hypothetical protein
MKNKISIIILCITFYISACTKDAGTQSTVLYDPATTDVTANASLVQLQQGKNLFISNCNACHQLYSPDSYTVAEWKNIISKMSGRTNLNSSQISLILKYVTRGK